MLEQTNILSDLPMNPSDVQPLYRRSLSTTHSFAKGAQDTLPQYPRPQLLHPTPLLPMTLSPLLYLHSLFSHDAVPQPVGSFREISPPASVTRKPIQSQQDLPTLLPKPCFTQTHTRTDTRTQEHTHYVALGPGHNLCWRWGRSCHALLHTHTIPDARTDGHTQKHTVSSCVYIMTTDSRLNDYF